MRAGNLRSRITIKRLPTESETTQNTFGEDVLTEPELGDFWADIRSVQGRELESMQQTWAEARFKVVLRYQSMDIVIRRKDKIYWGERILDILDVEDQDQRRRELTLIAKEFTA